MCIVNRLMPDRPAIRPNNPLPLRGRVGERGVKQKNTVIYPLILTCSRRGKEPFFMSLARILPTAFTGRSIRRLEAGS